jgi:hypothetical protein
LNGGQSEDQGGIIQVFGDDEDVVDAGTVREGVGEARV